MPRLVESSKQLLYRTNVLSVLTRIVAMKPIELESHIETLRHYYAQHGCIPPLSHLAHLWGYGSKSWAAAIAARLVEDGFLAKAPGRRLGPGKRLIPKDEGSPARRIATTQDQKTKRGDPIDAAASSWATEVSGPMAESYALAFRIVSVARLIEKGFRSEAHLAGINAGELLVLDALYRAGPPYENSPAQLRQRFLISFAGISKRIDRLTQRGYVERSVNRADRRSQVVRLTTSGLALVRSTSRRRNVEHKRALFALSDAERRQLADTLKRLQSQLEA